MLALFVALLGTACVLLGRWQLARLDERRERNAVVVANESAPVVPWDSVFGGPVTEADQWQRVEVRGTFDPDHQFLIRFRSLDRAPGIEVVTPLRTTDGRWLLVDRGFLPVPRGTAIPDSAPPAPTGEVTVVGHVRSNEQGRSGAVTPVDGRARLVNAPALGAALPYPVVDGYLGALEVRPAQTGDFRAIPTPQLDEGPHFWYAVQWFMFASLGLAGLAVFVRADLRDRRTESGR